MKTTTSLLLTCVCTTFLLSGCGGGGAPYEGERRFPISGTVSYQGEAIPSGMISLVPEESGMNPAGGPITDGKFSVPENQGVNKGRYRVQVFWHKPTGKKIQDADTGEEIDEVEQVIPAKYNNATELTADISGDPETDNLDLKLE